jgi:hypothetical protein
VIIFLILEFEELYLGNDKSFKLEKDNKFEQPSLSTRFRQLKEKTVEEVTKVMYYFDVVL